MGSVILMALHFLPILVKECALGLQDTHRVVLPATQGRAEAVAMLRVEDGEATAAIITSRHGFLLVQKKTPPEGEA